MSYSTAIDQLNAMVPELYTGPGRARRKFSLDEIRILLEELGNPQFEFPSVLIAGTNGKGSTAATLASILTASGSHVALYTSPHLARVNERMRIGGAEIADQDFARIYFRVHDAAQQLVMSERLPQMPSYFEILTALAFVYFAEAKVDIAVLEVGMGGRLDATNVVEPLLSIITDISLDHMEWLGSTVGEIAREKAGILRRDGVMVTLPQHPEANQALGEIATELDVRGVNAARYLPVTGARMPYRIEVGDAEVTVDSPLAGEHQHRNLALAIAAAQELADCHNFRVTPQAIAEGVRATRWFGRLERIMHDDVEWVLDVAHNPAGAWALRAGLRSTIGEERLGTLIFSCLRDKPLREMARILFPLFSRVVLMAIHTSRASEMSELISAAQSTGTEAVWVDSVREAIHLVRASAQPGQAVVISGSVYLVGEARSLLLASGANS